MATAEQQHVNGSVPHETDRQSEQRKPSLLDQAIERTSFDDPLANLLDRGQFDQILRVARMYAHSSVVPEHLHGHNLDSTVANMCLVINQAIRWRIDPFAVMSASYVVAGKLGYEGKLVAAVINTRAGIEGRLRYTFEGSGKDRTVTVYGKFPDEDEVRTVTLNYKQGVTYDRNGKEKEAWTKDPDQKLCYSAATKWARRHCPQIMMGVYTDDDLDQIENEPVPTAPVEPDPVPRGSRADALAKRVSPPDDDDPFGGKPPKSHSQTSKTTSEPVPEPADCPSVPDHLKPAREQMLTCRTSDELLILINKLATEPDDFDSLQTVADWLIETGQVETEKSKRRGKPKQTEMLDRGEQYD